MVLATRLGRSAAVAATGGAAALALVFPAHAADEGSGASHDRPMVSAEQEATTAPVHAPATKAAHYKGRVIARSGLLVRNMPTSKGRIVGSLKYHQIVGLKCKAKGQNVGGNNRWYRLSNGAYAWASARYIQNVGQAPHWCR